MKVTITFETDMNEDGLDQTVTVERNNMVDLNDMAYLFVDSIRAGGFTYVERVGIDKGQDEVIWSIL
ncbi:MAG: hypothetical protein EYR95_18725 [Phormidium sp. SL48-SHIP]|nr:MAG: hypothetical protein EYR95_18725 [Phormidium sp. SL48-SHIP]